eukprot:6189717-Pleurochrysis_carterae.AAC.1
MYALALMRAPTERFADLSMLSCERLARRPPKSQQHRGRGAHLQSLAATPSPHLCVGASRESLFKKGQAVRSEHAGFRSCARPDACQERF